MKSIVTCSHVSHALCMWHMAYVPQRHGIYFKDEYSFPPYGTMAGGYRDFLSI